MALDLQNIVEELVDCPLHDGLPILATFLLLEL